MNAQTEQLIYWKQRHDKLAEQHAKAVEALRQVLVEVTEFEKQPLSGACVELVKSVLAAIEEPTDA